MQNIIDINFLQKTETETINKTWSIFGKGNEKILNSYPEIRFRRRVDQSTVPENEIGGHADH